MKMEPWSYLRTRWSGFVAREKMGCSIDAISPFGAASKISQTKKSGVGCRSGNSGARGVNKSKVIALHSSFHTPSQAVSTDHTLSFVISHTNRLSSTDHTPMVVFDRSHTGFRHFTHQVSTDHTPAVSNRPEKTES